MKTLLRSKSCKTCPFRGGFHLDKARRTEIMKSVVVEDLTFHCHSEVDYDGEDEEAPSTHGARQCAGASTLLLRDDRANQVMRFADRFGETLTPDEAIPFDTWEAWINEPEFATTRFEGSTEPCAISDGECEAPAGWMGSTGPVSNVGPFDTEETECCGEYVCGSCSCYCEEDW